MIRLDEIINNLPQIISRNSNISSSIDIVINEEKNNQAKKQKYNTIEKDRKALDGPILSKHDPYLHKLCEMIYSNIKSRFQIFANAFCYLDFKSRQAVSIDDFSRGMDGFGLKMSPQDSKSVFAYLTGSENIESALMTSKQFCKLQEEFKDRNVDPYELQVFQEQYSLNLKDNKQPKLFDEVSVTTSNQYKGLKN